MEKTADAPATSKEVGTDEQGQTEGVQPGQGKIPPKIEHADQATGEQDIEVLDVPGAGSESKSGKRPREVYIGTPDRPKKGEKSRRPDDMDDESRTRRTSQPAVEMLMRRP